MTAPTTIDPIADPRWATLVAASDAATPFHHPAWLTLLREQYGYDLIACCAEGPRGELDGGLPLARIASRLTGSRLVALPFSDLCPPLRACGAPAETAATVLDALEAERLRRGLEVEVRADLPGAAGGRPGARFLHHAVPLEADVDAVAARFSRSQVRRGIAKAEREGVTVRQATDVDALKEFYRLHLATRRRQGAPTQPWRFIRRFAALFEQDLGFVLLARVGGRTIAAAVFLELRRTLVYKYGASDRRQLDKRPNNLLFMEAIRHGCERGARRLDLGRTDLANAGLRRFKLAWGAEESELAYTRLGGAADDALAGGGIPPAVGAAIRRGPPLVGRAIGAAFYGHFG